MENEKDVTEVKTFTQDEVNNIVGERLAREREKYEGINLDELKAKAAEYDKLEEANKTELQKASEKVANLEAELASIKKTNEVKDMRSKVASEYNVPLVLLTGDTEDECVEQANAIKTYANPGYPEVKDAGEVHKTTSANTRTQFAEAFSNLM